MDASVNITKLRSERPAPCSDLLRITSLPQPRAGRSVERHPPAIAATTSYYAATEHEHHCITASLHHCITASLRHCTALREV